MDPNILAKLEDATKLYYSVLAPIEERIYYVLTTISKALHVKFDWWAYDADDQDGGEFQFYRNVSFDSYHKEPMIERIFVEWSEFDPDKACFMTKLQETYGIDDGLQFPLRWLSEDFEQELEDGIRMQKEFLIKEAEQKRLKQEMLKEKKQKKAAKLKETFEGAKQKLSPEEIEALKAYLK